ncbi:Uncharacterised protein [Mycobacteroides abscessus subsp. massiliense]|nr:Uncharacterised protein [Mycobacteroides abscessus subsp. massiliense]
MQAAQYAQAHFVFSGEFYGTDLQDFRAEACQFDHFFKCNRVHAARFGYDARVGGVNAVHVGVNLAFVGFEGCGDGNGGGVRTAAAEG